MIIFIKYTRIITNHKHTLRFYIVYICYSYISRKSRLLLFRLLYLCRSPHSVGFIYPGTLAVIKDYELRIALSTQKWKKFLSLIWNNIIIVYVYISFM